MNPHELGSTRVVMIDNGLSRELDDRLRSAAEAIAQADALLIGAGAGMGVDSGLPDFRGNDGFWKAYPPFRGKSFHQLSTPHWFRSDPHLAWGFFGHRLNLYRRTVPHHGFGILRRWSERMRLGAFVFTSNVDGQFQQAGFDDDMILECHGSIRFLQCTENCTEEIWSSDGLDVDVDDETIRCRSELPRCRNCRDIARPNILMFHDSAWNESRTAEQSRRYAQWRRRVSQARLVAVECGAGVAIPTVRRECERLANVLIRINPREPETGPNGIPVPLGAGEALRRIDEFWQSRIH